MSGLLLFSCHACSAISLEICEQCNGPGWARLGWTDIHAVLPVQRFDYDHYTLQRSKVRDRFEFPAALDMFRYTAEGLATMESGEASQAGTMPRWVTGLARVIPAASPAACPGKIQ